MDWQSIAFFSSIVLTFLLTTFLAWYAFKTRKFPGVRAYGLLALTESVVSLAEILSMVSPQLAQAQFWFNVRFLPNAFLPVIFVVFAFRYNNHDPWLSKRIIGVLTIIPIITQVMVWTNNQYHLWVVKDVLFLHNDLFWIADITARVPSLWFMVHTVYSILLMVTGITVLIVTAWQKRHEGLGQSILLSLGALIGLALLVITSLNLMPNLKFNIFVPGLGLSALLYAFAILRFNFLKVMLSSPQKETQTQFQSDSHSYDRRSFALFFVIFLMTASGIFAIGYLSYRQYTARYLETASQQLDSIAKLKVNGLEEWRHERTADVRSISQNSNFTGLVDQYIHAGNSAAIAKQILDWLEMVKSSYNYERIYLTDSKGNLLVSTSSSEYSVPDHIKEYLKGELLHGEITWLDFHRHEDGTIRLAILSPIFHLADVKLPEGLLVFEMSADQWVYPYLQTWPLASSTAETLLVRADGDSALFLTPVRFEPDAALKLRIPVINSQVLAVKGVIGIRGIVEGVDYRGQQVIGSIQEVPDSPWILVARMDKSEVYAPLKTRLWQTIFFFGILILSSGGGLTWIWRNNRMRFLQNQVALTEQVQASEEKFRKAFSTSPDALVITRAHDDLIILYNEAFLKILGYSDEDVHGKNLSDLHIWENTQDREKIIAELQKNGNLTNFAARFRKKSGDLIYGLVSATFIDVDGQKHILSTTRDVTDQKLIEQKIKDYSEHLEELVEERTRDLKKAQERALRQERLATLGQLAGSIAHELRNPLGVISNATAYLSIIQPKADPKVLEYLEIIKSETKTSEKIITDLLEYTHLQVAERTMIKVEDILNNSLKRFPPPKNVELVTNVADNLPEVYVNGSQMEQVLGNLITNAYQAMPKGGRVTLSAEAFIGEDHKNKRVKISVADTGEGISPDNLNLIFEPLFTTKPKGIGLGLPLCKKYVEANRGEISVISKVDEGATFNVVLPTEMEKL